MTTISSTVGQSAHNRTADVIAVQSLLNNFQDVLGLPGPMSVDGQCGSKTVGAIKDFQRHIGLTEVDGRVDPNGFTIKHLNERGAPLVQLPFSEYYYSYATAEQQWGEPATIQFIEDVAKEMYEETGYLIGIGHISLELGGPMEPHKSHRTGEDVDIRPCRLDDLRKGCSLEGESVKFYSRARTAKLIRKMTAHPKCKVMYFNDDTIRSAKRKRWPGHHNHIHARILSTL